MKRSQKANEEKTEIRISDILAVTAVGVALSAHLFLFFSALAKQFDSGWTAGTALESGSVMLWVAQAATIPFLLWGIIYFVISLFRNRHFGMRCAAGGGVILSFLLWLGALLVLYL